MRNGSSAGIVFAICCALVLAFPPLIIIVPLFLIVSVIMDGSEKKEIKRLEREQAQRNREYYQYTQEVLRQYNERSRR